MPAACTASDLPRPTRRQLLRWAGASAVLAAGGLLGACSSTAPPAANGSTAAPAAATARPTSSSAPVQLPTYQPVQGPPADLPGDDKIDAGYFAFPKNLIKTVTSTPVKGGGEINVMTWNVTGPIAALDNNAAWQAINTQLGAKVNLVNNVAFSDYNTKLATVVAGSELPDVMYISASNAIQQFPSLLDTQCTDLTPYLSGDAVKDYPNLANIPTNAWRNVVFNNKIYGLPVTFPLVPGRVLWMHQEMLDAAHLQPPRSADDFKQLLQALADQNNTWGIGGSVQGAEGTGGAYDLGFYAMVFNAPNNWSYESGTLTKDFETDQYKAAVAYARELVTAGLYHPDSATYNQLNMRTNFAGRRFVFNVAGWLAASIQYWQAAEAQNPPGKLNVVSPFGANGARGSFFTGPQLFGFSILKKAPEARIRDLLGMLNFLAAPFGSQEHLLLNYGVEGTDFTYDDGGNPILTTQGKSEVNSLWGYIVAPPQVYYNANHPRDYASMMQAADKALVAAGVADPTTPYYSTTNASKGASISQEFLLNVGEIIAGRRPLSDYDGLLQTWQTNGGNQIRSEFQHLLQS